MSLSDCRKCLETPCVCGHEYERRDLPWLIMMRDMFQELIDRRQDRAYELHQQHHKEKVEQEQERAPAKSETEHVVVVDRLDCGSCDFNEKSPLERPCYKCAAIMNGRVSYHCVNGIGWWSTNAKGELLPDYCDILP